jgi:WD40 repeat protein
MAADPKQAHVARELVAEAPLMACRFDPAGKRVFATAEDRVIYRWDLAGDQRVALTGHDSWIFDLAFTADGGSLISAGGDDTLIWWPAADEAPQPQRKIKAHEGWIRSIALSPDGSLLASGGNDRMVRLWNPADGAKVREFSGAEMEIYSVAFHPSGQWLVAGDLAGKIHQWEVGTGKAIRTFDASPLHSFNTGQGVNYGGVRALTFSPDGKALLAGGLHQATNPLGNVQQPIAIRFDWETGKALKNHVTEGVTSERIWSLCDHRDGFLIGCLGGAKGHLDFWKATDEKPFHVFALPSTARGMAPHPDGMSVATTHFDKKVRITRLGPKG